MDYRSCAVMNKCFKLNDDGSLLCLTSQKIVTDGVCRAYIFANMFFYDYIEKELSKIMKKLDDKMNELIDTANIPPDATERLYPPLSVELRELTKTDQLNGLIKDQLSKIKPHISLMLTPEEEASLKKLKNATFVTEYEKFKNVVLILDDEMELEKELTFTPEFLRLLTPRAKRLLSPAIKITALLEGGFNFQKFNLNTDDYKLTYIWGRNRQEFDEESVKNKIKELMQSGPGAPQPGAPA